MKLYHATFQQNLQDIIKNGLGAKRAWNFSQSRDYLYTSTDKRLCERIIGGAVMNELIGGRSLQDVVVLSFDSTYIESGMLTWDSSDRRIVLCKDVIPPGEITVEEFEWNRGKSGIDHSIPGKRLIEFHKREFSYFV
jgi:hypothetical protein